MEPVTYCTNIHPGETWAEVLGNLETQTLAVKRSLSPHRPFPVGLRISRTASQDLGDRETHRFKDWLEKTGLYVLSLNGFPYGRFHGVAVKSGVYQPDWRHLERLNYTKRLAETLACWLPPGRAGSISTVPLGFKADFPETDLGKAVGNLRLALEHLDRLAQTKGQLIRLSLEPEPGCWLETTPETVRFFTDLKLPAYLRPYLAICFDCCHQALQFEEPRAILGMLRRAEIPIGHVQVSSALHLAGAELDRLARYQEPVYLHQVVGRRPDKSLVRHDDLPQALAAGDQGVECWRVHFHLPVFLDRTPECASTQDFLREVLPLLGPDTPLEVETYTWSVLPPELRAATVSESIVREIAWVEKARLG